MIPFTKRRLCSGVLQILVIACMLWPLCLVFPSVGAGEASERVAVSRTQGRPWILVSLSPSGCSRGCKRVFSVVRELSGNPNGRIIHFDKLTPQLVSELEPEFIILGPQGTPWCRYSGQTGVALQNFLWALPVVAEEEQVPILGICGGHQALALAFGGKVGPIRAGEYDCLPYSRTRQSGVAPVKVLAQDPIFRGVGSVLRIVQSHYDEVKVMPPGFRLLASEAASPVQIMRHPTIPVYGVQGHPEVMKKRLGGGAILIRNFIHLARKHNRLVRKFPVTRDARYSSLRK